MNDGTTIHVSSYVKDKLDKRKEREDHKSYDSVIRTLFERNEAMADELMKLLMIALIGEENVERLKKECKGLFGEIERGEE